MAAVAAVAAAEAAAGRRRRRGGVDFGLVVFRLRIVRRDRLRRRLRRAERRLGRQLGKSGGPAAERLGRLIRLDRRRGCGRSHRRKAAGQRRNQHEFPCRRHREPLVPARMSRAKSLHVNWLWLGLAMSPRQARLTLPPAWRSSRPASSSSSSTVCTVAGARPDWRISSSTGHRRRPEQAGDRAARRLVGVGGRPRRGIIELALAERADAQRAHRLEHVLGGLDQGRALADQEVAALRARIERRARHRHHLAAIFGGVAGGDQRARSGRGLDHHRAVGQAGDDPVAIGEMARARLDARAAARRRAGRARRSRAAAPRSRADRRRRSRRRSPRSCRCRARRHARPNRCPRASPETTTVPAAPSAWASGRAKRQAAAEALRAPTSATAILSSRARSPLTISAGGAVSSSASSGG